MKKHYDNPKELLNRLRAAKEQERAAQRAPFSATSILFNYALLKDERMSRPKLIEYNQKFAALEASESAIQPLNDKLWEKVGWRVEYGSFGHVARCRSLEDRLRNHEADCNNHINEECTRCMVIGFNVLMEMGYGAKRLTRVKDAICKYLEADVRELNRELIEAGIIIEMPAIA